MTEYLIFGIIIAVLSIVSEKTRNPLYKPFFLYLSVLCVFLIGCRYYIGADWSNYKYLYQNGYTTSTASGEVEVGYMLWNKIISAFGFESGMYFAITAFASFMLLFKAANIFKVKNYCFSVLVYYCLFLPSLQLNIVRTGLLASCFMLGLAYRSIGCNKKAIVWMLIGASMHYLGLALMPLAFLVDKVFTTKWISAIFVVSISVFVVGFGKLLNTYFSFIIAMDQRINGYVDNDDAYGFSLGSLFNLVFFVCLYCMNRTQYNEDKTFRVLLNTYMISICMAIAFIDFSIFSARICQVLNIVLIMLWPLLIRQLINNRSKLIIPAVLFLMFYLPSFFLKAIGYGDKESLTSQYPYDYRIEQLYSKY